MQKRSYLITIILLFTLVIIVSGCVQKNEGNSDNKSQTNNSSVADDTNATINRQCGQYSYNGNKTVYCAVCGDGVCEEREKCTPSAVYCENPDSCVATADCGLLYCYQDCP